ncbi:hypothetical protein [Snodgrassella alvi]|uniref:hypothetical protein n=1 Tax=Snodgrassella alvi TaxID=1196083 RepID=UPI00345FD420
MSKITAITYYRFDEDYLLDYQKNLKHLCDNFLIVKDTEGGLMHNEGKYRQRLYQQAFEQGTRWAVVLDPDERLEKRAIKILKNLINNSEAENIKCIFQFNYREMYSPNEYRCDGIWNEKKRVAIFPLLKDNIYSDASLHMPKHPLNSDFKIIDTGLNIYHLKHIIPTLRKQRRDLYEKLDSNHIYQKIGYDYLIDESDLQLTKVPWRRRFVPKYRDYQINDGIYTIK